MPITPRQFELGINDVIAGWMQLAHVLLAERRDLAYNTEEIMQGLGYHLGQSDLQAALDKLVEIASIEVRIAGSAPYYRYATDLPPLE